MDGIVLEPDVLNPLGCSGREAASRRAAGWRDCRDLPTPEDKM